MQDWTATSFATIMAVVVSGAQNWQANITIPKMFQKMFTAGMITAAVLLHTSTAERHKTCGARPSGTFLTMNLNV